MFKPSALVISLLGLDGAIGMVASGPKVFQSRFTPLTKTKTMEPPAVEDIIQFANGAFTHVDETLSSESSPPALYDEGMHRNIEIVINNLLDLCRQYESQPDISKGEVKELRASIRAIAFEHISAGPLGKEIATWPRGPGSSSAMNFIYEGIKNLPTYSPKAHYMDWYLRDFSLAHAVRSRKDTLRDILREELAHPKNDHDDSIEVLDLANGPIQSLKEVLLSKSLDDSLIKRIRYHGYDTDSFVQFSNEVWIKEFGEGINPSAFNFYKVSALKAPFVKTKHYDVVYSTGFFDYLPDRVLVKLWKNSFDALKAGGSLIISLKDSDRYASQGYHYLMEWDQFYQRNAEHFEGLLEKSGMPPPEKVVRDSTGIILFYVVRKN